jgi:hypothetical protein
MILLIQNLNILIQLFEDVFEHFYFQNNFVNVDHKNYRRIFVLFFLIRKIIQINLCLNLQWISHIDYLHEQIFNRIILLL